MSELKAYYGDVYIPVYGSIADAKVYLKSDADKVIARHKYKRCLAMAKRCTACRFAWSFIPEDDEVHKSDFYDKWKFRWLELAKKFKEAK